MDVIAYLCIVSKTKSIINQQKICTMSEKIKIQAIKFEVVDGKKTGKAFSFERDPKEMAKYKTEATVRKKIEEYVVSGGVFKRSELSELKYSGMKDFLAEWKKMIPMVEAEELAKLEDVASMQKAEQRDYNLHRFIDAQDFAYTLALRELKEGRKRSHWIWYIFPQQKGLGHSHNSQFYGLDGEAEARAYIAHPVLGERLRECCRALLLHKDKDIEDFMGSDIDVLKLNTSMNLFNRVSPNDIFAEVIAAFF